MEPTNLDSSFARNDEDARLAAWLGQIERTVPDDGFSARVLAALPRRRSSVQVPIRSLVCSCAGCLGALVAWWRLSANGGVDAAQERLRAALGQINEAFVVPAIPPALPFLILLATLTGASVLFALRDHLRWR